MSILKFYIDSQLVREPLEWKEIEIELNFEDINEIQSSITQDKLTFVLENADFLNTYLIDGTTGGLGIYWGVPFRMELGSEVLFDGYIDLTNEAEFSCSKIIANIREARKLDWIDKVADGFSFDLLYSRGIITTNDFVKIPVIQSDIPDYKQASIFFLYSFVITRELQEVIKELYYITSDLAGVFSSIAGVLKLIFYLVYLITLIIAIIAAVKQMISELIQPVRYHLGLTVVSHFEKACSYLGYTFQSSIFQDAAPTNNELTSGLWKNLCLLPEKNKRGFKKNESTKQMGYFNGTFGDFLRGMEGVFNAKFTIINGVFRFERRDYGSSSAVYKIPNVRRDFHGTNADEIISNYLIQFQVDNLDLNTIVRYKGTNAKNYITSKIKDSTRTELIRGLFQPSIPFALGRRKNELTRVEQLVKDFLVVIDGILSVVYTVVDVVVKGVAAVVKAINKIIKAINTLPGININTLNVPSFNVPKNSLSQVIDNRIGMLSLSDDIFGVPKLILIQGSGFDVKITTDNETKLSAENLWNKYHYLESMVPTTQRPTGNQAYVYSIAKIPFCKHDYDLIKGSDEGPAKVVSPEGNPARIRSLKWNPKKNYASIKYYEEKLFTTNLEQTLLINEGE